jgi:hypothetical protein
VRTASSVRTVFEALADPDCKREATLLLACLPRVFGGVVGNTILQVELVGFALV